ncbi:DUF2975 domain-containing protein [Gellertiella hungarica]|uniref:DUF2975 domain-containing protein n=1 Tax=Gellertiella hungarica TaxID=1572859 RepID=A0A7W6J336_9HYPH|nr:DUF2975 domain-containing protein [Gellertiella hungarica]MBB4063885.1 hypothetical protein [Gellertiella hungarica]
MRDDALAAIRTISRRAKALLAIISAGLVGGAIYLVWKVSADLPGFTGEIKAWLGTEAPAITLSGRAIAGLAALGIINAAIAAAAIWTVWRLFDRLEKGRVFTRQSGELLRLAGALALTGAISTVVSRTLATLIATYDNPPGEKILLIGFGSSEGMLLLLSALLYAMGHVIALASDIERENRSFV